MEGKKKNKKKKNKQNKTTDVSTSSTAQKISKDNNGDVPEENHHNLPMETQGVIHLNQSGGAEEDVLEYNRRQSADSNVESQKDYIEGLLRDKQLQIHKEAELHEKVRKLQEETDYLHQKEVDLEIKVGELQEERESWHQKKISLEKYIGQLMQEKDVLCSTEAKVKALEDERVSSIRKEVCSRETISSLNDDISRLQVQVAELEESKRNLSLENQQMVDKLSTLQSRIQELEGSFASAQASVDSIPKDDDASETENLKAEIESACSLIEKLVSENAELIEKVNELCMELSKSDKDASRHDATSSVVIPNSLGGNTDFTFGSGFDGKELTNDSVGGTYGSLVIGGKTIRENSDVYYSPTEIQESSESSAGGGDVLIPLDENEGLDLEGQALIEQEVEAVSLTDAPLIGAPFRLISFFASYVSGADLVDKDSNSGP